MIIYFLMEENGVLNKLKVMRRKKNCRRKSSYIIGERDH